MAEGKTNWFKKHKILTVALALVLVFIIAAAASGSDSNKTDSSSSNSSSEQSQQTPKNSTAKTGEPARDGKFEFVVKSIICGKPNVGSDFTTKTAQGQYCLLDVSVKNIGNEAQSLYSGNQFLFNSTGQKYSADDTATYYAAPSGNTWYDNINPGNSVEGVIVFDIPKDQTPTSAELHDSALSGGVKVNLQ
ncbi:hypothetical protein A3D14_01320 [Candidatus Saccharibacteria bacterium RIFCSPHIGHO2_02_FULL_47_12]|nr:MAG: hypothetical protein A3D14_01320 [Candidatus Saccharibacteria bacterium RIFCSPHIGHO2_02_FULL_47_12]